VEGKIFFAVLAKRMTAYMTRMDILTPLSRRVVFEGVLRVLGAYKGPQPTHPRSKGKERKLNSCLA